MSPANNPLSNYRPDIDGLRAIAVLSVVGYHAFPTWVKGGFIGVDIFFVISGFLISTIIFTGLERGSFSFAHFYSRRIRRIFPALLVVLIACYAFGWQILLADEYKQLGKHIAAGAGFVSNIVLWRESGYFDVAAELKPLLHLWSLGIEEQFYIFWPLILWAAWKRKFNLFWLTVVLAVFSLGFNLATYRVDRVANFYNPLSRFWELLAGAWLAYLSSHSRSSEHPFLASCRKYRLNIDAFFAKLFSKNHVPTGLMFANTQSALGLFCIAAALLLITKDKAFPGTWALLPVSGAVLVLAAGSQAWFNRNILSSRLFVWFGLISYPLYLWHWPILSFARIMESETPSRSIRIAAVLGAIVLAWLTMRFIERPLRFGGQEKTKVAFLVGMMLLVLLTGEVTRKLDGVEFRITSTFNADLSTLKLGKGREMLGNNCGLPEEKDKKNRAHCSSGRSDFSTFVVFGDSKAEALYYGLERKALQGMLITPPRWAALPEEKSGISRRQRVLQTIQGNPSIKVVIFAVALRSLFNADSETGFITDDISAAAAAWRVEFNENIRRIENSDKRVIFIIDNPTLPDPRNCISGGVTSSLFLNQFIRRKPSPRCNAIRYTDHLAGTSAYRQFVADLVRDNPNLVVYDPTPILCDIPNNICTISRNGKFFYSYTDHISDYANTLIADELLPVIERLAR